jgi:hypothetical protein
MSENGRIARFVKAARSLLLMQLAAALFALLLAAWAVTAVWELAAERDRLREQVRALQSREPAAAAETVPTGGPMENGVRPPAILPIAIPVPEVAPDVNMILPGANSTAPATNEVTEPTIETPAEPDCSGTNAAQPRCRPGRWNRPVPQRQPPRTEPEPQPDGTPPAPRGD